MGLEHLWAGWRGEYVANVANDPTSDGGGDGGCVFCRLAASTDEDRQVIARGDLTFAVINAFPYNSGHLMVAPLRHVGALEELTDAEAGALMTMMRSANVAVRAAYRPDGVNVGMNLGRAAGAGIPGHLHVHVLPRWEADTNFLTTVTATRVLPEPLSTTWERLRAAWPA